MFDDADAWPVRCSCGNEFTKRIDRIVADHGATCFDCGEKLLTRSEYFARLLAACAKWQPFSWQDMTRLKKRVAD